MNNSNLYFQCLQLCSGHYLCATIPDNWYDLTSEQQNEFLVENNFEPFENYDIDYVWQCIENAATVTQGFIEAKLSANSHNSHSQYKPQLKIVFDVNDILHYLPDDANKDKAIEVINYINNHGLCNEEILDYIQTVYDILFETND